MNIDAWYNENGLKGSDIYTSEDDITELCQSAVDFAVDRLTEENNQLKAECDQCGLIEAANYRAEKAEAERDRFRKSLQTARFYANDTEGVHHRTRENLIAIIDEALNNKT